MGVRNKLLPPQRCAYRHLIMSPHLLHDTDPSTFMHANSASMTGGHQSRDTSPSEYLNDDELPHSMRGAYSHNQGEKQKLFSPSTDKSGMLKPERVGLLGFLSSLDAYPKIDPKYLRRTTPGGLTTILVGILLAILVISDFISFFSPVVKHEFLVDRVISANLPIQLDISVSTPCDDLVVQFIDPNGQSIIANRHLNADSIKYPTRNGSLDGCRIHGSFPVNKVAGKIEIIPLLHMRLHLSGIIDLNLDDINFSHTIHHMSFGKDYPGQKNPLDGTFVSANGPFCMYQYFISVIPTWYHDVFGTIYDSNQYAVTDYQREISEKKSGTPGIFFRYELDSISVHITEEHIPLLSFLVNLVGILGGIFTCSGIMHHLVCWVWSYISPNTFIYEPVSSR
jgi:hypothetical protein